MTSQSGGGSSTPFSGASVQNLAVGQTLGNGASVLAVFPHTVYDTDGYLTDPSTFTAPRAGYYALLFGFVADSPFAGQWELEIAMQGVVTTFLSGTSVAGQLPEDQVYNESHLAAGGTVTFSVTQTSGADQLIYPYARVHFIGA